MFPSQKEIDELMHDVVIAHLSNEIDKGIKLGCESDMHNLMVGLLELCYKNAFPSLQLICNINDLSLKFEPITKNSTKYPVAKKLKLHNTEIHLIYIK